MIYNQILCGLLNGLPLKAKLLSISILYIYQAQLYPKQWRGLIGHSTVQA
jgi:hypothetical protein